METAQLKSDYSAEYGASNQAGPVAHPSAAAHTGIVKWFNPGKGYGFIAPETGGDDIFVHISAVQRAGLRKLTEGERVRFALQQREGRVAAVELQRLN